MSAAKELREKLGITQLELAHLLGIALSTVAMSETGVRELPTDALHKISEIEMLLTANPPRAKKQKVKMRKEQAEKLIAQLKRHAHKHQRYLHPEQQKAIKIKQAHTQASTLLHFIQLHRKTSNHPPRVQKWMELMEQKANDTIEQNNTYEQDVQDLIVRGLLFNINEANKLVIDFENKE